MISGGQGLESFRTSLAKAIIHKACDISSSVISQISYEERFSTIIHNFTAVLCLRQFPECCVRETGSVQNVVILVMCEEKYVKIASVHNFFSTAAPTVWFLQ